MWAGARIWIAATAIAVGSMALLLFSVGLFLEPPRVAKDVVNEIDEPVPSSAADTCSFRVSGTVMNSAGQPIESAIVELKEAGPFATPDRITVTNYAGRFLYTESGYGTCYMEDLFPTIRSQGYQPWSRDSAAANDEAFEVVLSISARPEVRSTLSADHASKQ